MEAVLDRPPWETLKQLIVEGDGQQLAGFLEELGPTETVRTLFRLSRDEQQTLLRTLSPESAAELIEDMPDAHAAELIDELPRTEAASIVDEMTSDEQVDLLHGMDEDDAEEILLHMDADEARRARRLIRYPDDVAGGLMMTECLKYPEQARVGAVIEDLSGRSEDYALYNVQYIYVTDAKHQLAGVLRLRDMVFADPRARLATIMKPAQAVAAKTPMDRLRDMFEETELTALPVVNTRGRLLGVVRRRAVLDAIAERAQSDSMKQQGIMSGEELRSMPMLLRARRRLSWLSINIVLNIIAASVIAFYQETIAAVIALAVFLPIVSDMSGCSGNQAVAVSLRELTLGIIKPADLLRVWLREVSVGLLNGVVLGALLGALAWLWKGSPWLGAVVGAALAVNTVVAVSIGGSVPLLLRKLKVDPALASGPVLTTITDMCGFFLVLSLASLALTRLT